MKSKSIFRFANENSNMIINSQTSKHFFDITNCVNNIYYLDARIHNKFKWITFANHLIKQNNLTYTKKLYKLNKNYNDILERQIKHYFNRWKFRFQWKELIKKLHLQNSISIFKLFSSQVHNEIRQDHFEKWYKLSNKLLREFRIDNLIDIYSIETNNNLKKNCFLSWKETFMKRCAYIDNLREKWTTFSFYLQEKELVRLLRKERRKLKLQLKWIRLNRQLYLINIEHEYDYYILRKRWKLLCNLILKSHKTNSLLQAKRRIQYQDTFRSFSFQILQINSHKKIVSEHKSYIQKRALHEIFKKYIQLVHHEDLMEVYQIYQKKLNDKNNKCLLKNYVKRWNNISHIMKYQRNFMRISFKNCIDEYYLTIANISAKIIQKYFRVFLQKRNESKKLLYHWFIKWKQTPKELTYEAVEFPQMSLNIRLQKMQFSFNYDFLKPPYFDVFNVLHNVYQFNEFEEKVKDATSKALEKMTFNFLSIPNSTYAIENVTYFNNIQHKIDREKLDIINKIIPKIDLNIPNDLFSNSLSTSKYFEKEAVYSDSKFNFNKNIYCPKLSLELLFSNKEFQYLNTGLVSNKVNIFRKQSQLRVGQLDLSKPLRQLKIKLDTYEYPISFRRTNFLNELASNELHNKTRHKEKSVSNISIQNPILKTNSSKYLEELKANEEYSSSPFSDDLSTDISNFIHFDFNLPILNLKPLIYINSDIEIPVIEIKELSNTTSSLLDSIMSNSFTLFTNKLKSLSYLENASNNVNLPRTVNLNYFKVRNTPNFDGCIKKLPFKSLNKLQNFEFVHKSDKTSLHQNSFDATIEEIEEDTESDDNVSFNGVSESIVNKFNIDIQYPLLNTTNAFDSFELNDEKVNLSFDSSIFDIKLSFDVLEKYPFNRNSNGVTSLISNSLDHLYLLNIYWDLNISHFSYQEINVISSQITANFNILMPSLGSFLTKFVIFQYHPKIQFKSDEIEHYKESELTDSDENDYFEITDQVNETIKTPEILLPNSMSKAISIMRSLEINNISQTYSIDLNCGLSNYSESRAKQIANEIPFYFSIDPEISGKSRHLSRMNCLNNQSKEAKLLNS